MWDRKCQEINTYIESGKCTEAWKFIKNVRTSEKESVHLQMIPIDRWVQYYQDLTYLLTPWSRVLLEKL